jgi:biopolymer transport protein ExbD
VARRVSTPRQEVEINLTSALDVIFNILAFFIITFSPPAPERNFDVSLPPPKPVETKTEQQSEGPEAEPFKDVTITIAAKADGSVGGITLENRPISTVAALSRELDRTVRAINAVGGDKLEAATIIAAPTLKYRHLIETVDACYRANIQKINFAEGGGAQK